MFTFRQPSTESEFAAYFDLRWRVLRQPWNQPRGSEKDELESTAVHVAAYSSEGKIVSPQPPLPLGEGREREQTNTETTFPSHFETSDQLLGIGRLHKTGSHEAQIRYMAVEEKARGQGVGRAIVERLESIAREQGVTHITLNARKTVADFYHRLGYQPSHPGPTLFGTVEHVTMVKELLGGGT